MAKVNPLLAPALYVVEYKLSNALDPHVLQSPRPAGLEDFEVFASTGGDQVLTYWKNEQAFQAARAGLAARLGLTPAQAGGTWAGSVRQTPGADSLRSRVRKSLRGLNNFWRKYETVPHVAEFDVPAAFDHTKLEPAKVKGLLYVQTLVKNNAGRLLTFWRDQPAYDAQKAQFATAIKDELSRVGVSAAAPSPSWEGLHRDARGHVPKPWWTYVTTIWAGVATFFAMMGYLDKLRDYYAWLLAPAVVEVVQSPLRTHVTLGERFDPEVEVRNISALGTCAVRFDSASFEALGNSPKDGLRLDPLTAAQFPTIKPGDRSTFKLKGQAGQPGEYRVIAKGESRSGFLRGATPLTAERVVQVWNPKKIGQRKVGRSDPRRCAAEIELIPGRAFAKGLDIEASLQKAAGVRLMAVRFPLDPQFDSSFSGDRPDNEVALLVWRTGSIDPFKPFFFTLLLSSESDKTEKEWDELVTKIDFKLSEVAPR